MSSVNDTRMIATLFQFSQGSLEEVMNWLGAKRELDRTRLDFMQATADHQEYLRALDDPSKWTMLKLQQGDSVKLQEIMKNAGLKPIEAENIGNDKNGTVSYLLRKEDYEKIEEYLEERAGHTDDKSKETEKEENPLDKDALNHDDGERE